MCVRTFCLVRRDPVLLRHVLLWHLVVARQWLCVGRSLGRPCELRIKEPIIQLHRLGQFVVHAHQHTMPAPCLLQTAPHPRSCTRCTLVKSLRCAYATCCCGPVSPCVLFLCRNSLGKSKQGINVCRWKLERGRQLQSKKPRRRVSIYLYTCA